MVYNYFALGFHDFCEAPFFKNESEFITYFNRKVKDAGGFAYKLSDFSPDQKPFDCIYAYHGYCCSVEFKFTDAKSFKPYYYLRGSGKKSGGQTVNLRKYARNGGNALVIVYSSALRGYIVFDFTVLDFNNDFRFVKDG